LAAERVREIAMAEEEKKEGIGGPDLEESGDADELGEATSIEKTEENGTEKAGEEDSASQNKGFHLKALVGGLSGRKWTYLFALGFVLIIVLLALNLGSKWLLKSEKRSSVLLPEGSSKGNLIEEPLQPFFIPLPPGGSKILLRIELNAVWDSLTSVVYRKNELPIRDRLYRNISALVAAQDDLDKKTSFLEEEMMMTVRKFPGMDNFEIRIKEAAYF